MPRVTAILVVHDGDRWLDRTLAALASQTRRPDALVVVAEPTTSFAPEDLERAGVTQVVTATGGTFGVGIARALRAAPPAEAGEEWLWLLRADSAPEPDARGPSRRLVQRPEENGHVLGCRAMMDRPGAPVPPAAGEGGR